MRLKSGVPSRNNAASSMENKPKTSKVRTVMMPSPYTADISWLDAREMAERMGVRYDEISIVPEFEAFKASLAKDFAG